MEEPPITTETVPDRILDAIRPMWGFDTLRPLQREAIEAAIAHRDSLVVMPTGGGKSLCYQVPPLITDRVDVVVSPLIALMKDQVDGLVACGYPATALHSHMDAADRRTAWDGIRERRYRLLFVSPERLLTPGFMQVAERLDVRSFAIDEAHCISQWGHDFRPEYRQLATLKQRFPRASLHAYTATATERVRRDIAEQLQLDHPAELVGVFDRPNLTYRIIPRVDIHAQIAEAIGRHPREAVIVYCLSRRDTENMAERLGATGIRAQHYHAGMSPEDRRRTQEAFASESLDVVTATVAFGMGIDRSNVRCVIHATLPKSIEHYQQETGRAGRDGLEAECVLFYSAADVLRWKSLIQRSARESGDAGGAVAIAEDLLEHMRRLCTRVQCRHRLLSEYFGQAYTTPNCGACDVCLGDVEGVTDATVSAQKILSCIARVEERFGVGHIVDVLSGADTDMVRRCGHEELSTYGLLSDTPKQVVTSWVYQLVDQDLVDRTAGDRPILQLNPASWEVLRGERPVMFVQPKQQAVRRSRSAAASWEGVDSDLFEHLRAIRRDVARERGVPAYVIFSDASLRDMARRCPENSHQFGEVHGVGAKKLRQYGDLFIAAIRDFSGA